jgi:hypothetical protein
VRFELIVARYAGVESRAAVVLDGDDVERRIPVGALRCRRDGELVDL